MGTLPTLKASIFPGTFRAIPKYQMSLGEDIMDGGLTELFLGVTAGAFSPLALFAAWERYRRTRLGKVGSPGIGRVPNI